MFRSIRVSPKSSCIFALAAGLFTSDSFAVTYEVRALTRDSARSVLGAVKQGSFGAPALNDKGVIAYPCFLYGGNVSALTNSSIISRTTAKSPALVAMISGVSIDNSFLPSYSQSNTYGVLDSARVYKFAESIAINNANRIAFIAEVLNTVRTDNFQMGNYVNNSTRTDDRASYGVVFPSKNQASGFQNACITIYETYDASILDRTVSINNRSAVSMNASYQITATRQVPGFHFSYPTTLYSSTYEDPSDDTITPYTYYGSGFKLVATTESNVIGLSYETVFSSFSDALISNKNRCFVVADISDTGNDFDGLWQGSNPNLNPVVVKQTPAPGGGTFESFDANPGPNRKGQSVAFIANVTGADYTRAVYRSNLNGKKIDLIASLGSDAPGTDGTFSEFTLAAVDDRGRVAIFGTATDNDKERTGVWVTDAAGKNLTAIVVTGQTILVRKKQKTVSRLACNPVAAMNSRKGQIAFTATFTDRTSAVLVAKP